MRASAKPGREESPKGKRGGVAQMGRVIKKLAHAILLSKSHQKSKLS